MLYPSKPLSISCTISMNHVKTSTAFSFAVIIYLLQYNTTLFICYNIVNNKSNKTWLGLLQSANCEKDWLVRKIQVNTVKPMCLFNWITVVVLCCVPFIYPLKIPNPISLKTYNQLHIECFYKIKSIRNNKRS